MKASLCHDTVKHSDVHHVATLTDAVMNNAVFTPSNVLGLYCCNKCIHPFSLPTLPFWVSEDRVPISSSHCEGRDKRWPTLKSEPQPASSVVLLRSDQPLWSHSRTEGQLTTQPLRKPEENKQCCSGYEAFSWLLINQYIFWSFLKLIWQIDWIINIVLTQIPKWTIYKKSKIKICACTPETWILILNIMFKRVLFWISL